MATGLTKGQRTNKESFLADAGNKYYFRRGHVDAAMDNRILKAIDLLGITPNTVCEIGCSDGKKLSVLKDKYNCECYGIDPSSVAISNSNGVKLQQGTADSLPYIDNAFDVVIYGFCLYLCDRNDLFKIAAEGNRILKTGGYLIVEDFYPDHRQFMVCPDDHSLTTMKTDYAKMWIWHPAYEQIYKDVYLQKGNEAFNNPVAVQVFHKKECK